MSRERLSTYLAACSGSVEKALELYRWNAAVSAAFWEPMGHLEVALRNALSERLRVRHERLERPGSWLDDPGGELGGRARADIAAARARVRRKRKLASDGQTISELSFGFWRFLVARRLTSIWPDLAGAFPHAPDRRRDTVEVPVARLHQLRNRVAHHQRIWNHDLDALHRDLLTVTGYLDAILPPWIVGDGDIGRLLVTRPII